MKHLLQDLQNGTTTIVDSPVGVLEKQFIQIVSHVSLVSAGTERMVVDFGKANFLNKALQQPEKVKQVLNKVLADGLIATVESVRSKLQHPIPLGYANVGEVSALGSSVVGYKVGDRVVSNGHHADVVTVPWTLCAKVPDQVDDEEAVFTVVASIGLQGIRLANPSLGECVVVTGVGLIGLLTVQMLIAQGCRVLAIDFDDTKLVLASKFGAEICNPAKGEDTVAAGLRFSRGRGVDAVIITASTKSSDPVAQAAHMCRKRGRIVLVGVTGLNLNRSDFYEKELTFQVSCSYGPGRYDSDYEEGGKDYPLGFVRWTEQRNFEAVLDLMASGKLNVKPLITHRFAFEEAANAYAALSEQKSVLGILLRYQSPIASRLVTRVKLSGYAPETQNSNANSIVNVAFIGAGNYASRVLMPAFNRSGANLRTVVTSGGLSAAIHGKKLGFSEATTNIDDVLNDTAINSLVVATRHDSHAEYVVRGLKSGKHVFVEKPLCISRSELASVIQASSSATSLLTVGFNRRFAPQILRLKALLDESNEPFSMVMSVNAGPIPADHWTQDPGIGGGRLIGEACHFVDLLRHLAGAPISKHHIDYLQTVTRDSFSIQLRFENGSIGIIHYLSNGHRSYPKERLEVFCVGRVIQLNNFIKMRGFGWPGFSKMNLWRQDKGQSALVSAFVEAVKIGGPSPIPKEEIFEVMEICLNLAAED
jgi:predicted dehydrogenase/threonine dehydrogenase-like Zn-dependent dehydrogenase